MRPRCDAVLHFDSIPYRCQYESPHIHKHSHALLMHLNKDYPAYSLIEWGHPDGGNLYGKRFHMEWRYDME